MSGMMRHQRTEVDAEHLRRARAKIELVLERQTGIKGTRAFVSSHEILGALREEVHEFEHAVQAENYDNLMHELRDIAVVCLWGLASGETDVLHWPKNPHRGSGVPSSKWPEDNPALAGKLGKE